ncbi:hypothetical protein [Streptomyces sp. NPDC047453]|uniref:hypothetical protein n=1 Tax=Streptomyces sp. NPDC047453 TaxID=3154812 RepID=UPI0033F21E84
MQWTDESGGAYGEDPYGGVGYAYDYGYEYSGSYEHRGSATTDTATRSWDPELAQWTYPTGNAYAGGTVSYATGTHLHATGAGPATARDAPHGDVLTVPPPELDMPGPSVPGLGTPKRESVRPVFVDSSGRRQRRVLRAARLLVIPAGGYIALLISTVVGGPSLSAPFVPQPDSAHPTTPRVTASDASPGTGHSAGGVSPTAVQKNSRPTGAQKPSGSTDRSTASATLAATPAPTAARAAIASPTSAPTAAPTSKHASKPASRPTTSKGRAIGSSHNPVK